MSRECDSASEKENCKGTGYHVTLYLGEGKKALICLFISPSTNRREMPVTTCHYSDLNSTYF